MTFLYTQYVSKLRRVQAVLLLVCIMRSGILVRKNGFWAGLWGVVRDFDKLDFFKFLEEFLVSFLELFIFAYLQFISLWSTLSLLLLKVLHELHELYKIHEHAEQLILLIELSLIKLRNWVLRGLLITLWKIDSSIVI